MGERSQANVLLQTGQQRALGLRLALIHLEAMNADTEKKKVSIEQNSKLFSQSMKCAFRSVGGPTDK